MRTIAYFSSLILTLSLIAGADQEASGSELPRVYCKAGGGPGGFVGPGAGDSTKDLIKSLRKKEVLQVVDSEALADIVVTVRGRERRSVNTGIYTTDTYTDKKGRTVGSTTSEVQGMETVVHAVLQAGEFQMELQGRHGTRWWGKAAGNLADQIADWIEENQGQILAQRPAPEPPPRPAAAPASAGGTMDADIEPGMTMEQVRAALGEPAKIVNFGARSLWDYGGFKVVFEQGAVTEVKF